jgi:hypothetical protein
MTYTVWVNNVSKTFETQEASSEPFMVSAALGRPFRLKVDQTGLVDPQGPMIDFVGVEEDSRCPVDVECVWAGRAVIKVRVSSVGDVLGFGIQDLTLEAGLVDPEVNVVKGVQESYLIALQALDPYPQTADEGGAPPDYIATLVVSKLEIEPVATNFARFYLIVEGDAGNSGPPVGCGDSAVAVWRDRTLTGSHLEDLRASLEELFSIKSAEYGDSGFVHSLYDSDLAVERVEFNGDTVEIDLTGTLRLLGTCADARMQSQILLTVFQFPGFMNAMITIEGRNMKQVFDLSGMVGPDDPYHREDVEF